MMRGKQKLSLIIAIIMLLQIALPASLVQKEAAAATLGPVVVSLSPADDSTNAPLRPTFRVTFDENIVKHDNNKKITVYRYNDNAEIDSITMSNSSISISNNVLSFSFKSNAFALDTEYYVLIE